MQVSNDWEVIKKQKVVAVSPRHHIDVQVSSTDIVTVSALPEDQTEYIPIRSGHSFRLLTPLEGFQKIKISAPTEFGLKLIHKPRQYGEPNSGEKAPVVTMPEPSNLVLKMRQIAAQHHRETRAPVLEPEEASFLRSYEHDDDAELLFEEEAIERHQQQQQQKAEEANKRPSQRQSEAHHTAKDDDKQGNPRKPEEASETPPNAHAAE